MKCRSMASEYLPVGIPVLQIKDIRVDRAAILILVGSCYFLHQEPTKHWKIWNPVLKTEKLLIFLLFFRQTSYRVLHFETKLYKFAALYSDMNVAFCLIYSQLIQLNPFLLSLSLLLGQKLLALSTSEYSWDS